MNQRPHPADDGADEALLEVAPHQLEQQAAPSHQVSKKELAGNSL